MVYHVTDRYSIIVNELCQFCEHSSSQAHRAVQSRAAFLHLQRLTQPFCTCMIQAHGRLWKPQVRLSSLVHTDCPLSSSSPNWLAKAAQELLAVTGPICDLPAVPGRLQVVQRFVILLYGRTSTCTDIDKARWKL